MAFAFEKLHVYQKAIGFAGEVCSLTREFPRGYFFLADQLNRAALSIAANIAEGNGRFTKADRRFFLASRGAACRNVSRYWSSPPDRGFLPMSIIEV
jgi:four helix bundle protein